MLDPSSLPTLPPGAACAHQGCQVAPTHGLIDFAGGWLVYFCFRHLVGYFRDVPDLKE